MENTVDLKDIKTAYKYKSTKELRFTYFIFKILQYPWLVRNLTALAERIVKKDLPFQAIIKRTIFRVFCSGETIREAFDTIGRLNHYKVKSVLDYVSEAENTHEAFDTNRNTIVANIEKLGREAPGNSVSVKLSSLEDPEFFRRINNIKVIRQLNDEHRYALLVRRLDMICAQAEKSGVIIYVDAEDRFMQDIFDHLVEEMMEKYNKKEAVVYNTLQMYLSDRAAYLKRLLEKAADRKFFAGIKLVRGAYVEKEKYRANLSGLPSPVFENKDETDNAFNQAVEICLSSHRNVYTCVASHNEKSTLLALACIRKYNITDHFSKVRFSQLYGMSDHLTFNLAAGGFNSSKYLPYGELKKAIPYLIRRAEENSSINGQINGELGVLRTELERRRKSRYTVHH
jgi:proline dehydrogenase